VGGLGKGEGDRLVGDEVGADQAGDASAADDVRDGEPEGGGPSRPPTPPRCCRPVRPTARRDLYHLRVAPGSARESVPQIPGTVEHLIVSTGRPAAGPWGESVELGPGDYVAYRGGVPHTYEALAPGATFVLVMRYLWAQRQEPHDRLARGSLGTAIRSGSKHWAHEARRLRSG
jgi:mannose-6-phosphate isomerase-like protein (cupin superfamily)